MNQIPSICKCKESCRFYTNNLHADEGELTRTLKIRRNFVEEQYQILIDGMYTDTQEVHVQILKIESIERDKFTSDSVEMKQEVA